MIKILVYYLLFSIIYTYSAYSSANVLIDRSNITDDDHLAIMEKILIVPLEKCEFNRKNVLIYDDLQNSSAFRYLPALKKLRAVTLLSEAVDGTSRVVQPIPNNIAIELIVLVITDALTSFPKVVGVVARRWVLSKNCTVIQIIANIQPKDACDKAALKLSDLSRSYLTSFYYICVSPENKSFIYTMDFNGDTQPLYWKSHRSGSYRGRMAFLYYREYREDDICQGFFFERSSQLNSSIMVGVNSAYIDDFERVPSNLYNSIVLKFIKPKYRLLMLAMHQLLKTDIIYSIPRDNISATSMSDPDYFYFFAEVPDVYLSFTFAGGSERWVLTVPIIEDAYVILTHNRGIATPLEKIARFYGYVTLIGIIIISLMAFIAIWLIKNPAVAAFDVVRLLINTGLFVPMTTHSSRIFFFCIFLFFTVFHATFSGNLAKFLTSIELRKNVDTTADLEDSRIETIYNFQYNYKSDNTINLKILSEKSKNIAKNHICRLLAKENPKSACISNRLDLILMNK